MEEKIHAKTNLVIALFVFAVAFVIFVLTAAPTVAFWDCGEYVASGSTMGVPHPPGNILFITMLRVVTVLFSFFKDVGYRMNFFVSLISAVTASLMYLIAVRIGIYIIGGIPDNLWKKITVYTGGIVGGMFAVFGQTFWFSAVESSECNVSMFFIALSTLLSLIWAQSKDPKRDRLLILIVYISFLGIGVHMYSMIVFVPIFLFVMLVDEKKRSDWRIWLTSIPLGLVMKDLVLFIYVAPIVAIITLIMTLSSTGPTKEKWRFCLLMSIFAIIGFSCHLIIPIRSALDPMINENHPETWAAFKDYLQRKQYGAEDMISRMFWRRGSLAHQFGIEGHMGYGGFHLTQFFHFSPHDTERSYFESGFIQGLVKLLIYLIPTFFMIFGWFYLYKKNKNSALYLIVFFLILSIGITFYMNFADGTRCEKRDYLYWLKSGKQGPMPVVHREVRVRDYFWTPAFMFLGLWLGISATCLLHYLYTHRKNLYRTTYAPVASVALLLSPILPITQNWAISTRKGDFIPFDYAYNLLMSCEKDGIIFTNGDNDTFPLWALQEAYGIRKDVRIVNLSLVNTDWYIKQLKHLEPKVPISFTDEQITTQLRHQLNPFTEPTPYKMPKANIEVVLPSRNELNALRIQDQMVVNIVDANAWKKPIYFAVTVSDDNLMGLGPYLRMEGLAYRIMPYVVADSDKLNLSRTIHLLDNVFRFRGLGDGTAYLNDTSEKLLSNYAASYIQIALSLRHPLLKKKNEIDSLKSLSSPLPDSITAIIAEKEKLYKDTLNLVINKLHQCIGFMPADWRPRVLLHEVYMNHGLTDEAEKAMRQALEIDPENQDYMKYLVQALEKNGKKEEANEILKKLLKNESDPWIVYASLAKNYEELGFLDSAKMIMEQFASSHPGDRRAKIYIERIENLIKNKTNTVDTFKKIDSVVK